MSKKHFIALADAVRYTKQHNPDLNWDVVIGMLASFCASQNSNFNRDRWIDYINGECGQKGAGMTETLETLTCESYEENLNCLKTTTASVNYSINETTTNSGETTTNSGWVAFYYDGFHWLCPSCYDWGKSL